MQRLIPVFLATYGLLVAGEVPRTNYEYEIDTRPANIREGYVLPDAIHGSMVRIHTIETDIRKGVDKEYIRLAVVKGHIGMNVSFLVVGTDAFMIDDESFLVVNNSDHVEVSTELIFNVVMVSEPSDNIVSNEVPFAVHRDIPPQDKSEDYSSGAAIFAGVLVLLIVFMALLIPLVIRAKRRIRAGKHPFKLGSHPPSADKQIVEHVGRPRAESREPNWYNNTVFNYEDEVEKERTAFTHDILAMTKEEKPTSIQLTKGTTNSDQADHNESIHPSGSKTKGILKNVSTEQINTAAIEGKDESKL